MKIPPRHLLYQQNRVSRAASEQSQMQREQYDQSSKKDSHQTKDQVNKWHTLNRERQGEMEVFETKGLLRILKSLITIV